MKGNGKTDPSRRELLVQSTYAVVAIAGAAIGSPLLAQSNEPTTDVDVHIELIAEPAMVQLRSGAPTRVWRYRGRLLRGDSSILSAFPDGYLGPIIRVRSGQRVRIELVNGLPESTIIHWHGLHVPDDMDGHPRFSIAPDARYVYAFTVRNRAGSYWFHPHPHGRTGKQVHAGLAGLFIVSDDEETSAGLPDGAQDMLLVIQDRRFDRDNQFTYPGDLPQESSTRGGGMMGGGMMMGRMGGGMGSMMARMMGVLGDQILVNGDMAAARRVPRRPHRLRLFNAANTRTLKLAWSDGSPLTVIGTDGGLLAATVHRNYVMLAPAERIELWVDFGSWKAGGEMSLRSLAFDGGMMGGPDALPDGAAFDVQRFTIGDGPAQPGQLPALLAKVAPPQPREAIAVARPKVFDLTMGMMTWGINGESFDMFGANEMETVKLGTQEIWEFRNEGRGAMMGMVMPHSMHVHGLQFRVLSRSVSPKFADAYRSVSAGLVDDGWKDTVLVMPGERVRLLVHFADFTGLFLYHCHMLEHEDAGLMRNYRVVA